MQHLQPNTTLQGGKYRIERVLGQGGFGNTYVGYNTEFEETVAIKEFFMKGVTERNETTSVVSVSNADNVQQFEEQREKFKKEARRLRKLKNEHIVKVHDLFEENGTAYYVMDYIEGESLRTKLNREGALSENHVLKYLLQLLSALDTAHKQSIWHLDIKPENIMVDRYGHVSLIDFGASKHIEQNSTLTTSLALAYTKGYCPPELADLTYDNQDDLVQALKEIGPWTDIYALGATMYNLLTDTIPPSSNRLYKDGRNAFLFPSNVSSSTQDLIVWMMKPDREDRPKKVSELFSIFDQRKKWDGNSFGKENGASYEASQERHYLNHDEIQEKVRNRKDKHLYRALLWFVGMSLLISLLAIYFFSRILGIAGVLTISFIPSIEQSLLIGSIIAGILTRFFYDEL